MRKIIVAGAVAAAAMIATLGIPAETNAQLAEYLAVRWVRW